MEKFENTWLKYFKDNIQTDINHLRMNSYILLQQGTSLEFSFLKQVKFISYGLWNSVYWI